MLETQAPLCEGGSFYLQVHVATWHGSDGCTFSPDYCAVVPRKLQIRGAGSIFSH
jgi:hypothetical protein